MQTEKTMTVKAEKPNSNATHRPRRNSIETPVNFKFSGHNKLKQQHEKSLIEADNVLIGVCAGYSNYEKGAALDALLTMLADKVNDKNIIFMLADELQWFNISKEHPEWSEIQCREKAKEIGTETRERIRLEAEKKGLYVNFLNWNEIEAYQKAAFPTFSNDILTYLLPTDHNSYAQAVIRQKTEHAKKQVLQSNNDSDTDSIINDKDIAYVHCEAAHYAALFLLVRKNFSGKTVELYSAPRKDAMHYAYTRYLQGQFINGIPLKECFTEEESKELLKNFPEFPRLAFEFEEKPVKEQVSELSQRLVNTEHELTQKLDHTKIALEKELQEVQKQLRDVKVKMSQTVPWWLDSRYSKHRYHQLQVGVAPLWDKQLTPVSLGNNNSTQFTKPRSGNGDTSVSFDLDAIYPRIQDDISLHI